jgi:hypothetical protein
MFFGQSINIRDGLLNTALKATQTVHDLQRNQNFWDAVIEEIAAESPETARRIMVRLHRLNSELGMTFDARV